MGTYFDLNLFVILFFFAILLPIGSGLVFLNQKVPFSFLRIHLTFLFPAPMIALLAIIFTEKDTVIGPWKFDSLSWLLATFVLSISVILQRFSLRYLFGDQFYRKYFPLFTVTTVSNALAWCSNDMRLLLMFYGGTLFGLFLLMGLNREWNVARKAALRTGRILLLSWLLLMIFVLWLGKETGSWHVSTALRNIGLLQPWKEAAMNLLLVAVVIIPAAQFPFGRWLLNSVVAPTPVSAVMHGGIVNAGAMLLTRFALLFQGNPAQFILIIIAGFSVLVGTGIMLVQVDYKRQLVGSTIAQMGFMLIQCGLGAYAAALTHAVLHGLFKATLFLQSGSALQHAVPELKIETHHSPAEIFMGLALGVGAGIGIWLASPHTSYSFISAIILGWSVTFSWMQLVAKNNGHMGRITGVCLFLAGTAVYMLVHHGFTNLLNDIAPQDNGVFSIISGFVILSLLLGGSCFGFWLVRHRTSPIYLFIYFWLIHMGEADEDVTESHPKYLTTLPFRGGIF